MRREVLVARPGHGIWASGTHGKALCLDAELIAAYWREDADAFDSRASEILGGPNDMGMHSLMIVPVDGRFYAESYDGEEYIVTESQMEWW